MHIHSHPLPPHTHTHTHTHSLPPPPPPHTHTHTHSLPPPLHTHTHTLQCVKGHLSTRMLQPDNLWVEAWLSTTPLPAYKQKRLFDDTREAEKLLHFLAGLSPCQLALLLMPSLLHSAIATIMSRQGTVQYNTIYNEWRPLSIVSSKFIRCFKAIAL